MLTDREFGDWAKEAWPPLSDAVLGGTRVGAGRTPRVLEVRQVAGAVDRDEPRAGDLLGEPAADRVEVADVVRADHDERGGGDPIEPVSAETSGQTDFT